MEKAEQKEMLNNWSKHIERAINNLHEKFVYDSKFILTESDLKCWLFYFLQQEKPYIPYAVHTEVTHYAQHDVDGKETEKKYKFRDLSLLCPWAIKENEVLLAQGAKNKDILAKGFLHQAPAIHFELKLVRQGGNANILRDDLEKLAGYQPAHNTSPRHFFLICGSKASNINVVALKSTIIEAVKNNGLERINGKLQIILFDAEKIEFWGLKDGKLSELKIFAE